MTDQTRRPIRRALLSVYDKTGLAELGRALAARGVVLVSTGGSARTLREAGLAVLDVADVTGFAEMMDGRVKTLHPKVHGGLLAIRDDAAHAEAMRAHGIEGIDLLVSNLYPFEATVAASDDFDAIVEQIDIGGPAMIRAASKNHAYVSVATDPADYDRVLAEHDAGGVTGATRRMLAAKAFARTAAYDAAISAWFERWRAGTGEAEGAPARVAFSGSLRQALRYGENPHQQAAFYVTDARPGVATARQVQGKELSYNNINDTDAAYELVAEFDAATPAVAIIKHANPCGVATGATLKDANRRRRKIDVVADIIRAIDPSAKITGFNKTFPTAESAAALKTADVVFGCVDTHGSRLLLNTFAVQYMLPYIDIGVGIDADADGKVTEAGGQYRVVMPGGFCLECVRAIDSTAASNDLLAPDQRKVHQQRGYIPSEDIPAPAVVFLNGVLSSLAVAEFLNMLTAFRPAQRLTYYFLHDQTMRAVDVSDRRPDCAACIPTGRMAQGDLEQTLGLPGQSTLNLSTIPKPSDARPDPTQQPGG